MHRTRAAHAAMLVIGLALGIGAVAVAAPNEAPTAHSAAADSRIVRELQSLNKSVVVLNKSLTGYEGSAPKPISTQLEYICENTGAIDGARHTLTC
jgi:hypothetical protein